MNRRKFFSNLVASVGTLVAVYATPISRVLQNTKPKDSISYLLYDWHADNGEAPLWKELSPVKTVRAWIQMIEPGKFPDGMGEVKCAMRYEV